MKRARALLIVLVLLIFIIFGGSVAYILSKCPLIDDEINKENDEILKDISIKVSEILSFGETSTDNVSFSYLIFSYSLDENKTFIENIEEAKTYSILNSLSTNNSFKVLSEEEVNKLNGDYSASDGTIEEEIVKDRYKKVFGGNIEYKNIRACPTYKYNREDKLFYRLTGCGGTLFPSVLVHKDSHRFIRDKVEVELSIATMSPIFNSDSLFYKIYKGININVSDRVDESNYITSISEYDDIVKYIDENFEKFAKYKMTFTKDKTGNYIYESLKKI